MISLGMTSPPLDYSYRGITYMTDIRDTRPRKGLKPYKRSFSGRFWCSSFRLNNNNIRTIHGIYDIVHQVSLSLIIDEISKLYNFCTPWNNPFFFFILDIRSTWKFNMARLIIQQINIFNTRNIRPDQFKNFIPSWEFIFSIWFSFVSFTVSFFHEIFFFLGGSS